MEYQYNLGLLISISFLFQGITRNVLKQKPLKYESQLEKYFKKDGTFVGDFKQQKRLMQEMILNMKLINYCGDMTLKVCKIIHIL